MSRIWMWCAMAALVLVPGCGPDDTATRAREPSPAASSIEPSGKRDHREPRRCSDEIPFKPTYLPAGFEPRFIRGPAPGGRPPDSRRQVIVHLRSKDSRAIEVRRPGTLFAELALSDDAPTIEVLGEETADFGPIAPGEGDLIVFITYPPNADPTDRCASFSLNEAGLPLAELKKIAEGLRPLK